MSIIGAFFVFFFIVLIYVLIVEVITVLFRLTGLPERKARFQVISLLTNSGFTTSESEMLLKNPKRRSLAQKTMLFGYVFAVSIMSALVNLMFSFQEAQIENILFASPIPIIIILGFILFRKGSKFRAFVNMKIESLAQYLMSKKHTNSLILMDSFGHSAMAQIHLEHVPESLRNIPLSDCPLRENGVNVLFVKRPKAEPFQAEGSTVLLEEDQLVLFGDLCNMERIFEIENTAHQAEDALEEEE